MFLNHKKTGQNTLAGTKIITTTASSHLLRSVKHIPVKVTKFSDGELHVKIQDNLLNDKNVAVIAGFPPPAENLMELLLTIDALRRLHAKIQLVITYFGYARQDTALPGEALAAAVASRLLQNVSEITVIDMHSKQLNEFLHYRNVIPITPFLPAIPKEELVIVAPDKGAIERASAWQKALKAPIAFLQKARTSHDTVRILSIKGDVAGKNVLIVDDMITTGGTIAEAAKFLKSKGAKKIFVAATHGIFTGGAMKRLAQAPISKIFVTNTLLQKKHPLINVVSIDNFLKNVLQSKS